MGSDWGRSEWVMQMFISELVYTIIGRDAENKLNKWRNRI